MKNITSINQEWTFSKVNGKEERIRTTKESCKEFMEFCNKEIKFYNLAAIRAEEYLEKLKEDTEKAYPFPDLGKLQNAVRLEKLYLEAQNKRAYEARLELFGLSYYIRNCRDMEEKYFTLYREAKAAYNAL